ncbi:MAG: fused MFS/spermidine synthase [Planctomycetaceae bacterium]|nr:fused MFS/spermidine synthase [Planctomycetaceae bacterium]
MSGAKPADPAFGELLCRKNSLYTAIYVYQRDSIVTLRFGMRDSSTIQSQVDLDNPRRHMLEYTEMSFCGLLFNPDPNAVLVLGQGGGVIPRDVHHYFPNAMIDVVEIDGEISAVAEKYFDFRTDEKLRVRVDDGRMFIKKKLLREPGQKYDWVILDAFNGDYIPFHLMTKEFLQEVKSILTDDGVVVANVFLSNRLFDSELKTFRSVFGQCQVFAGIRSGNAMLAATAAQGPALTIEAAVKRAGQLQDRHGFEFDMVQIARRLDPGFVEDSEAMLLTDDRAPVNWLKTQQIR